MKWETFENIVDRRRINATFLLFVCDFQSAVGTGSKFLTQRKDKNWRKEMFWYWYQYQWGSKNCIRAESVCSLNILYLNSLKWYNNLINVPMLYFNIFIFEGETPCVLCNYNNNSNNNSNNTTCVVSIEVYVEVKHHPQKHLQYVSLTTLSVCIFNIKIIMNQLKTVF